MFVYSLSFYFWPSYSRPVGCDIVPVLATINLRAILRSFDFWQACCMRLFETSPIYLISLYIDCHRKLWILLNHSQILPWYQPVLSNTDNYSRILPWYQPVLSNTDNHSRILPWYQLVLSNTDIIFLLIETTDASWRGLNSSLAYKFNALTTRQRRSLKEIIQFRSKSCNSQTVKNSCLLYYKIETSFSDGTLVWFSFFPTLMWDIPRQNSARVSVWCIIGFLKLL